MGTLSLPDLKTMTRKLRPDKFEDDCGYMNWVDILGEPWALKHLYIHTYNPIISVPVTLYPVRDSLDGR
jgi:hypothetical protein